jgi:adenylate cyclase
LLAARIDRLQERERRLLQTAAVIGKRFPETILTRIAELPEVELAEALRTLRARDLIFEEVLFPELEYAFKHPLTQEVAYASQLVERRRSAHAAVAELIETEGGVKLNERAALIAHHCEAAGQALRAAGWHRRAAEWAESSAPQSTVAHWRAVRRLAAEVADSAETVPLRIAACVGLLRAADYDLVDRAELESAFEEGQKLALESGDDDARVRILLAYSALILYDAEWEKSAELLAEAEAIVSAIDDPELKFVVRGHAGFTAVLRGDQRQALERYDEAFALLGNVTPRDSFVLRRYLGAGTNRAMIIAESGRLAEAAREIERIRRIALEARDVTYVCIADHCRGRLAIFRGAPREALVHAHASLELAERLDAPGVRASARLFIGNAHLLEGNYDEAIAAIREAKSIATPEMIGPNQYLMVLARLAEACLGKDDRERALELSAEAVRRAEGGRRLGSVEAYQARARVLIATSAQRDADEIVRLLDRAAEIADRCGATVYEPPIREIRAALARAIARPQEAERELREALRIYDEMGASGHVERLRREIGIKPESAARVA